MTELSRERAELKSFITGFLTDPTHDNQSINSMTAKVFRIALTALDAEAQEPVAYIFKHPAGRLFWALTDESNKGQADVMPVYAEPQPVAVPDEIKSAIGNLKKTLVACNRYNYCAEAVKKVESACRAAMLQGKADKQSSCIPHSASDGAEQRFFDAVELLKRAAPRMLADESLAAMLQGKSEPVSQPYKLVGEVVAWNHPTEERRVDFRWIDFDVLPGTKLYAMPPETPQEPTK